MKSINPEAIIVGDSTHNTLGVIRSLGRAGIEFILILKGDDSFCNVLKSRWLKRAGVYQIMEMEAASSIFSDISLNLASGCRPKIMCTFDEGAEWIDAREKELCVRFVTPCRGAQIGQYFNKEAQCALARNCGLCVPESILYSRNDKNLPEVIKYPVIIKPLQSTSGEKSDIHICKSERDVRSALSAESQCDSFIIQEFIEKDYELDCIGVRVNGKTIISGAIRKIRHYPAGVGAGAYGVFIPERDLGINSDGVSRFLDIVGYEGSFSVEFVVKGDKYYFMEVNFRNDGLAYASTAAGANLHALYCRPEMKFVSERVRHCYMMNYAIDLMYVKDGTISKWHWLKDFIRTRCFININFRDLRPVIAYYKNKFSKRK